MKHLRSQLALATEAEKAHQDAEHLARAQAKAREAELKLEADNMLVNAQKTLEDRERNWQAEEERMRKEILGIRAEKAVAEDDMKATKARAATLAIDLAGNTQARDQEKEQSEKQRSTLQKTIEETKAEAFAERNGRNAITSEFETFK